MSGDQNPQSNTDVTTSYDIRLPTVTRQAVDFSSAYEVPEESRETEQAAAQSAPAPQVPAGPRNYVGELLHCISTISDY